MTPGKRSRLLPHEEDGSPFQAENSLGCGIRK